MKEIESTGKTVEEAIDKGLQKLAARREDVEIKILDEGKSGLFGLMGAAPSRVKLMLKNGAAKGAGAAPAPSPSPDAPVVPVDFETARRSAEDVLNRLISGMGCVAQIESHIEDERVRLSISSKDGGLLIGRAGSTMESLQEIVRLVLSREPKTRVRLTVDVEHYRDKQSQKLETAAVKTAQQVKRTGKPAKMDPMPSAQRRVVHMALKDDPDVETVSDGEGAYRKVVIRLKAK